MTIQTEFAAALLDPERLCPEGWIAWNGSDAEKRLAVYRNNVVASLIDALADTFPVTCELVSEAFFRAMAHSFVEAEPPRSPILAEYGHRFPDFIQCFPQACIVPYLADVARLEWLYLTAYHAADAEPLDRARFLRALTRTEDLPAARLRLHPSAGILRSSHAAHSLWAAHRGEIDLTAVDPYRPEDVLVVRPRLQVRVFPLRPGAARFLDRISADIPFGESVSATVEAHPEFDLTGVLSDLIGANALIALDLDEESSA
ncbi:HvfC/BufC N-terminal domain-containing protein [Methylohalobius crimeensis]|uniref:HvfC/BufC N-terminal domain-containing protein n=1 Tax=Methylohalobius crimeensis TaxID=244365 RepID=UPI0003B79033|nr:DNA-binding domain-containing protein [Methylohalobius crimeensis]